MNKTQFNIERDNELIKKGSHFWCGHWCIAVPVEEQSKKEGYCEDCYKVMRE